jgi:hypothetical protein
MKSTSKALGTKPLKLKYAEPLSRFAFKLNLRRYTPASLAVAAAQAGPAEAARARAAAAATGTTTNTLLLRAPDGRTVHVSAEHGSVSYRSPLAPRVTRLGRACHIVLATSSMPFKVTTPLIPDFYQFFDFANENEN